MTATDWRGRMVAAFPPQADAELLRHLTDDLCPVGR